jgi:hypothetical protein
MKKNKGPPKPTLDGAPSRVDEISICRSARQTGSPLDKAIFLLYTVLPMKRLSLVIGAALSLAAIFCVEAYFEAVHAHAPTKAQDESSVNAAPGDSPDTPVFPNVFLRDVVVSNSDRDLKNTDMFFNSEPGIAINPTDPRKIVVSAFSGAWSPLGNGQFQSAPIWYSTNGGYLWTKEFTVAPGPGVASGLLSESPCDETFDYDRNGVLYGTFLLDGLGEEGANCSMSGVAEHEDMARSIISGATADPANTQAWQWYVVDGKTQHTNQHSADQPWLIVNPDPARPKQENVYVAYQSPPPMQVAVAKAKTPPIFVRDKSSGSSSAGFGGNPGHRIAGDRKSGAVYSLFESEAPIQCRPALSVRYVLNRSLDGGRTWTLNGSKDGIVAAEVCSHQSLFGYSFGEPEPGALVGGVNPLKGGVDALAVDSSSGDVYVVYGVFDAAVNRDRIGIVRVTNRADGTMEVGPAHFVSGPEHQSALPAVAVTNKGVVAVMYDTADGLNEADSRPFFSVHMAVSVDQGTSFQKTLLQKFLFPENAPSGTFGARPLGDYQQLKSMGNTFYGIFSGDGQPFGRPFHKIDPIFVKVTVK